MAEGLARTSAEAVSRDERELRIELAACYRLVEKFGMADLIYTHISMRVPGDRPMFLLNPHGKLFDQITASSLVKVDLAGNIVGDSPYDVNRAGVAIHGAILEVRPDVNCVLHTHTPYAIALSAIDAELLPISQWAMRFHGRIGYHDYGRAATDPSERSRLAEDMGNNWAMILRNHGVLATGKTAGEAFASAYYLEKSAQVQLAAMSTGRPLVIPPENLYEGAHFPGLDERSWPALLEMLDAEDPSYRD